MYIFKFLKDFILNEIKQLEFPLKHSLTAFKLIAENEARKNEKEVEESSEEDSDIDERYDHINDFRLQYIKIDPDFGRIDRKALVLKKDQPKFGDALKNIDHAVKEAFRKYDLKNCLLDKLPTLDKKERIRRMKIERMKYMKLKDNEYAEFYAKKLSKYIFMNK